jgi:hypothetical protein
MQKAAMWDNIKTFVNVSGQVTQVLLPGVNIGKTHAAILDKRAALNIETVIATQ